MIVVTGATGNVGRPLVDALAAAGEQVVAVARRSADLPVRQHLADLGEPASLKPALDGADAVFLLIAGEQLVRAHPGELLEVVKGSGVRRVVLLSSVAAGTRPTAVSHDGLRAYERAVRDSGLEWTILRPGGFQSNALAWADMVRTSRTVAAPFGDVAVPIIDPRDIGEVAAAVLRGGGHHGRTYELTGPEPISPRQQAEAIGADVRFVELTRAQAKKAMLAFMPEPVADGTLDILGEPTEAERRVSPAVADLLGRRPGTFAAWVGRNATAFG
ncbi:SDR family oxidoreductase [Fodinicola acaciae]|uniref:SDR family oxidoreductase n=1 Tax=Fodinicola acaciae TaxID=2681555 RepID=UPI0013D15B58|nr:NAD(P)H-binding protein [Fodinicola acaciae]